jgi:hypothetical protein
MIRECFRSETGIMFKADELRRLGMLPESLYPVVLPRSPALGPEPPKFIERMPPSQPSNLTAANFVSLEDDPSSKLSEEEHDLLDALSPKYDQLAIAKTWWLGELMPMRHRYQRSNGEWTQAWGMNLGGGRIIPRQNTQGVKIHRSVKTRLEAMFEDGEKYVPQAANLDMTKVKWVE